MTDDVENSNLTLTKETQTNSSTSKDKIRNNMNEQLKAYIKEFLSCILY